MENPEKEILSNLYLGQIYDLDEQCKMAYGSESLYIGVCVCLNICLLFYFITAVYNSA